MYLGTIVPSRNKTVGNEIATIDGEYGRSA